MGLDISLVRKEHIMDANITHNLTPMWRKAGIYDALYNSEGRMAKDVLSTLIDGLDDMIANPQGYKVLNSPNGWGLYENAVPWLSGLVKEFKDNPNATIEISK